ncbi:Protein Dok-7, partial [Larimichthys crocea]
GSVVWSQVPGMTAYPTPSPSSVWRTLWFWASTTKTALLAWDARVRYSLGEVHRFSVNVEPGTKLERGPASLHLCNNLLVPNQRRPSCRHWPLEVVSIASIWCGAKWLCVRGGDSLWI